MSLGLARYLAGMGLLVIMLAGLGIGAYWLRRWIAPSYTGALARLAELVLALALLILTLELIGSFGLLREGWMVITCVGVGLGSAAIGRLMAPNDTVSARPPPVPGWALIVAVAVAAIAVGEWSIPSQLDLGRGIFSGDSTWYHLPFAARFAQSHSTWNLLFTDPLAVTAWFYPASSELLGSVGIILFKSDWLSALINLGWLVLGLLAAYCIGRPFGLGPATLVAAAIAIDSGVLLLTQAGEARNDAMGIALLIAFAALLAEGYRAGGLGPLALGGLAGGLAVSVKLTMLAPVLGATLAALIAIALRRSEKRLAGAAVLLGAEFVGGGYWYLRNLIHSGNPIPQLHQIGPLSLPHPDQMPLYPRGSPTSVAHYLFDLRVYRVWFMPKLMEALGPLYPLILALALAASIWAVTVAHDRMLRALGFAALLAMVAYLFTPLTAAGAPGQPHGFLTNTRYLLPGVALALALLPLVSPLRRSRRRQAATLVFLSIVFAISVASTGEWEPRLLAGSLFIVAALVLAPSAAGWLQSARGIARPLAVMLAVTMLVPAIALGRRQEVGYARHHYTIATLRVWEGEGPVKIFAWARNLHDQRIALAGSGELFFDQGIFLGDDSSNWVQYIGAPGPDGAYRVTPTCTEFRTLVDKGHYGYLVITEFGDNEPDRSRFPLHAWVNGDPELRRIRAARAYPQIVYAYRIKGPLDPRGCPK